MINKICNANFHACNHFSENHSFSLSVKAALFFPIAFENQFQLVFVSSFERKIYTLSHVFSKFGFRHSQLYHLSNSKCSFLNLVPMTHLRNQDKVSHILTFLHFKTLKLVLCSTALFRTKICVGLQTANVCSHGLKEEQQTKLRDPFS